jgi:hypothetical protein
MQTLQQAFTWIQKNPHNQHHLPNFASKQANDDEPELQWDCFWKRVLEVPGCLSGLLFMTNPLYRSASVNSKKQILRETILELEERIHKELVGRKWSRRKLVELVSAELAEKPPQMDPALEEALCELYQVQKLIVHHPQKKIYFFPEDPRVWKSGRQLLISDSENLAVYDPSSPEFSMLKWLQDKEEQGWSVQWPIAEGKLEDLKQALERKHLTAHPRIPGEKVKKDDYARILGRSEAISCLSNLREEADL